MHLINFALAVVHDKERKWGNEAIRDKKAIEDDGGHQDAGTDGKADGEQIEGEDLEKASAEKDTVSLEGNEPSKSPNVPTETFMNITADEQHNTDQQSEGEQSQKASSDSSDTPSDPVDRALVRAYTAKMQELSVLFTCFGIEHKYSQETLKHAWKLSRWHYFYREQVKSKAQEWGYYLVDAKNGSFDLVKLEGTGGTREHDLALLEKGMVEAKLDEGGAGEDS